MKFKLKHFEDLNKSQKEILWELICGADNEFAPPLSTRNSTLDTEFFIINERKPYSYFNSLIKQFFILVYLEKEICGFLSFRNNYSSQNILEGKPSNYVTTIYIKHKYRNKGLTKNLYRFMESDIPGNKTCKIITTRTWSTNFSHIHILNKLGYLIAAKLENHRDDNIDTIYFYKRLN